MKKIILTSILAFGLLFAQVDGDVEVPYISYEIKTVTEYLFEHYGKLK